MRLVIVGAGSQSTPHLFLAPELAAAAGRLQVTLVGRHDEKTRAVATAIETLSPVYRVSTMNIEDDLSQTFATADVILIQARYGDYAGRLHDETFPLRFGVPGDEGLGPGGLASAWRTWPQLAVLLDRIVRVAPNATILFLTAPLSILTRCASIAYPSLRWYALCELPWVTVKDACAAAELDPQAASFDYAGVNHLGWFDRLECNGIDLIEWLASSAATTGFPSAELIATLRALPLRYLELHYRRHAVTAALLRQGTRSSDLSRSADRAIAAYASGEPVRIAAALQFRKARWYYDAVAPFLAFLRGEPTVARFFLSVRNRGYLPNVAGDDVVEVPHVVRNGNLVRCRRQQALPAELAGTLSGFIEFERLSADALLNRDQEQLVLALSAHPWVSENPRELAREVLAAESYALA